MGLAEATGAVVVLALAGALHCVGMCGGLAVVAARSTLTRIPYVLGKSLTYALLGAAAGLAGAFVAEFMPYQRALTFIAGSALILAGLVWLGWTRIQRTASPSAGNVFARLSASLSAVSGRILATEHRLRAFGFGVANGFFPCGLVYGALAIALATSGMWNGALVMGVFGLATAPALLLSSWLIGRVGTRARARWQPVAGAALLVMGAITIWRGLNVAIHAGH